jgi:hypothetical protein
VRVAGHRILRGRNRVSQKFASRNRLRAH